MSKSKELFCNVNMFDAVHSVCAPDGQVIGRGTMEEILANMYHYCLNYECDKFHFYGDDNYIHGFIDPLNYSTIIIEVN